MPTSAQRAVQSKNKHLWRCRRGRVIDGSVVYGEATQWLERKSPEGGRIKTYVQFSAAQWYQTQRRRRAACAGIGMVLAENERRALLFAEALLPAWWGVLHAWVVDGEGAYGSWGQSKAAPEQISRPVFLISRTAI